MNEKMNKTEGEAESNFPIDKIIKRLEILKNVILLEDDEDDIEYNVKKLRQFDFHSELNEILDCLLTYVQRKILHIDFSEYSEARSLSLSSINFLTISDPIS